MKDGKAGSLFFISFSSFLIVFLLASFSFAGVSAADLIKTGDELYKRRAEGHLGDKAPVDIILEARDAYLEAYTSGDHSEELVDKLMSANYFYATYAEDDVKKQREALELSIKAGEELLSRMPDSIAVNYQMGGAWGRWGEVYGIFASARKGVAQTVREYAEKTVALDPEYAGGGGYRTLGRLHFKAPKIPFILSWPSKKESEKFLKKATALGPNKLTNHLFYAETLMAGGAMNEALSELEFILKAIPNPDTLVEDLRDQKEAAELKKKL